MNQKRMTTRKLEEALIYSCIVAGKSAKFADGVMARMLKFCRNSETLFQMLKRNLNTGTLKSLP